MVANTGTYTDSPFHRYAEGKDLSELSLESLVGIDSLNIDGTSGGKRPVHSILLGADIPIVDQWLKHNNALKRMPATPPPSLGVSRDSYASIHAVGGESWTKILLR